MVKFVNSRFSLDEAKQVVMPYLTSDYGVDGVDGESKEGEGARTKRARVSYAPQRYIGERAVRNIKDYVPSYRDSEL